MVSVDLDSILVFYSESGLFRILSLSSSLDVSVIGFSVRLASAMAFRPNCDFSFSSLVIALTLISDFWVTRRTCKGHPFVSIRHTLSKNTSLLVASLASKECHPSSPSMDSSAIKEFYTTSAHLPPSLCLTGGRSFLSTTSFSGRASLRRRT